MIFNIPSVSNSILDATKNKFKVNTLNNAELEVFEDISCKIALIQNTDTPIIKKPTHLVVATDHNISKEIINLSNSANELDLIIKGKAAINQFNKSKIVTIKIVDVGLKATLNYNNHIINKKNNKAAGNYFLTKSMDAIEYEKCITNGVEIVNELLNTGSNCISFGCTAYESNFSAAFLTATLTNTKIEKCVYIDSQYTTEQVASTIFKIKDAYNLHSPLTLEETMCAYGSYDIATIVGAILKAAEHRMVILIDNYVSAAALLFAHQLNENVINYCLFVNQSPKNGHKIIIDYFEKKTMLNLDYNSNIGIGIPLALQIITGAVNCFNITY